MLETLNLVLHDMTLILNFLLLAFFVVFGVIFWKENNDSKSPLYWIDMLLDKKTGKLSLTKFGQFIGIAMSTWGVLFMLQKLTGDQIAGIFIGTWSIWLTFLVAAVGIKSFSVAKNNVTAEAKEEEKSETK